MDPWELNSCVKNQQRILKNVLATSWWLHIMSDLLNGWSAKRFSIHTFILVVFIPLLLILCFYFWETKTSSEICFRDLYILEHNVNTIKWNITCFLYYWIKEYGIREYGVRIIYVAFHIICCSTSIFISFFYFCTKTISSHCYVILWANISYSLLWLHFCWLW